MTRRAQRLPLLALLVLSTVLSIGCAAERSFREAERQEQLKHWDLAVLAYDKAASLEPKNAKYRISLARARLQAASVHLSRGRMHRSADQLDLAQIELEQAATLDPTNDVAADELRQVQEAIAERQREANGAAPTEIAKAKARGKRATPPMLMPSSDKPIDVSFPADTPIKKIYQSLCAAAGINVIFDPQLKDDKFSLDLRGLSFQKALETAMRQAGHFYKVIDEKTIIIAQDTQQNRKEYEDLVVRTFFLSNGDVKDVSAMVRSILDLRRMGTIPQLNAIVIRDTADKVAVAEKLIDVNDKAKAEVVVDVELLQIATSDVINLGTQLSAYSTTISPLFTPATGNDGKPISGSISWKDLINGGITDFALTLPSVTMNFLKSNTDAELLAKPQLRIAEGEKATLVIGNRVPIPVTTVNTQQAIGQVGVVPITSFQYQDVGIKLDMEARVHHNKEVSLKLTVEVSNLNGSVTGANGQEQPIIATRTITSNVRLKEGETSFLAGLFQQVDSTSKSGIPFLADLPLIGPLFSNTKTQKDRTDIFMTITPHITRAPQITEDDLLPIWVGTENNVSFSGLNVRLESPTAPGSPFEPPADAGRRPLTPTTPLPTGPNPGRPAAPTFNAPVIQGTAPNDPFQRSQPPATPSRPVQVPRGQSSEQTITVPQADPAAPPVVTAAVSGGALAAVPAAVPAVATAGGGGTTSFAADPPAPAAAAFRDESSPAPAARFQLVAESETLRAGEATTLALVAPPDAADLGSVELTLEWDPAVADVAAIAAGPWRGTVDGLNVRFDADHSPGRARLAFDTSNGFTGLPSGVLARIMLTAKGAGTAVVRVSAGTALSRTGPVRPSVDAVPLTVEP